MRSDIKRLPRTGRVITRSCRRCMLDAGSADWVPDPAAILSLAAVSASSVGSLADHSLCNCEAVLRQYGGGRLLAQSITMRRVYRPDNQQTQLLLPRLRRPSKWELRSASRSPNDIAFRKCYLFPLSILSLPVTPGDVDSATRSGLSPPLHPFHSILQVHLFSQKRVDGRRVYPH